MGYEYTVRGWYKSESPIDLSAIPPLGPTEFDSMEHNRVESSMRVAGRGKNYVLFADEGKDRADHYMAAMKAVMTASGNSGIGMMTITGEWQYDGKDVLVLARNGQLSVVPILRFYDPLSPWEPVYRRTHYMARRSLELEPPDGSKLATALAGRTSVKGWADMRRFRDFQHAADRLIEQLVGKDNRLQDGIRYRWYSEPHLLIGQQQVDAASVVMRLVDLTARHKETYGLLFCSDEKEQLQVPVAFEDGKICVLSEINLTSERDLLPEPAHGSAGMGDGFQAIPIRFSGDLDRLYEEIAKVADGKPLPPANGFRQATGFSGPAYLFTADGLGLILTVNEGQVPTGAHSGWPYLLVAYLEGAAESDQLNAGVRHLVQILTSAGIEVGTDNIWPGDSRRERQRRAELEAGAAPENSFVRYSASKPIDPEA